MNEMEVYLAEDEPHTGYRTVYGGERFPYHGNFVPGSANGISFEDLVVIETYEFCRSLVARRRTPRLRGRARVRARAGGAAGVGPLRPLGGGPVTVGTATVGVAIGVGRIGSMHADLLDRRIPGATLAAVHDAVPAAAQSVGARAHAAVDEPLADLAVDAVAICSSTETHADLIVAPLRAGKAIFCEKWSRSSSPRSTARWRRSRPPMCRSRSGSTAASTPPIRPSTRRSCAATSATRSWCGSAATRRHRR